MAFLAGSCLAFSERAVISGYWTGHTVKLVRKVMVMKEDYAMINRPGVAGAVCSTWPYTFTMGAMSPSGI